MWDPSHHPLPLTPAFGSVYPGWIEEALRVTFAEFGMLPRGVEARLRDGYLITRVRPPGVSVTPPAWLASALLRLWWLHPEVSRRVRTAGRRLREGHSAALLRRWQTAWRPAIRAQQERLRAVPLAELEDSALADHIESLMGRSGHWVTVHFLLHGAIALPLLWLERFLRSSAAGRETRLVDLLQGGSAASSGPARALVAVAAPLREMPELVDEAAALSTGEALALLQERLPEFRKRLGDYLDRFGHGIVGRYEFVVPTLKEQPEALLPTLLEEARRPGGDGSVDARASRLMEQIAGRLPDPAARERLRRLAGAARRAYAIRDDNVQITFVDAFGLDRLALLEAGRRLAGWGVLAAEEEIFFLTVPETLAALRRRWAVPSGLIGTRRERWLAAAQRPPPPGGEDAIAALRFDALPPAARDVNEAFRDYMGAIMATDSQLDSSMAPPTARPAELRGIAAVRGRYRGRARVLRGQEDFDRLEPGDVLVCPITSPAWAAVLPFAGALVTDHGGVLSHPAVIAREFGIPAVVATRRATALIPDGATVEVDGDAGVVRIVG